ncbi:trehalose-6-phosphate synthase [Oceanicella sp. SM1341]|uniref:alpha,alpha-trehalose-phosphate synthase (UDP-forming) n=1 Tax=Oceanicella sp. SM1341 TaxID=1548889 RepID=UPI000E50A9F1|nr:trehalose-6-phosphate synthase [Oceanicella sp. SM1341]
MSRIIVVSNRLPSARSSAGGLAVALSDCLSATGGVWIGTSDEIADEPEQRLHEFEESLFVKLGFALTRQEHENYYLGYSNSVLWPVFHGRADLMDYHEEYDISYHALNARLAQMIAGLLRPGDLLWVQDYHFLPLASELRRLGVRNAIGLFLHIPFPDAHDIQVVPDHVELLRALFDYDLIGLQTRRDVNAFLGTCRTCAGAELLIDGTVSAFGKRTTVASFPIGIDTEGFALEASRTLPPRHVEDPERQHLIIGVDRLDYSKGLPQRFLAYERLLETHPELSGRVSFLQIAPPTRSGLRAYSEIRSELERLAGCINGAHADIDWTPLRYIHRALPREQLGSLYRRARVGLVTPLADGMNLVAKEYVAAQDPENPGVLVLSRFAGAAEQMGEALLVNPHDRGEVAQAIHRALRMPLAERRTRHAALMGRLLEQDITWWSTTYLKRLREVVWHRRGVPEPSKLFAGQLPG